MVSRSYISYDDDALEQKLASNPFSFIHVINPDHGRGDVAPAGSRALFKKVREKYLEFYEADYFVQDERPALYVYRQSDGDKVFTGIIGATASKDYAEGHIKKHELTLTKRERMFTDYLDTTGINAEPVLLTYRDDEVISKVMAGAQLRQPIYDFNTADRMRHSLWAIDDTEELSRLQEAFLSLQDLYIADGHHRTASSARLTSDTNGGSYGTTEPHDFFMSYLVPASQMRIEAFHRLIHDPVAPDTHEVLEQLKGHFNIEETDAPIVPRIKGEMCLITPDKSFILTDTGSKTTELDVQHCSDQILEPVFGITDARNDKRVSFINGARGIQELVEAVSSGRAQYGIALYPIQIEEVLAVADRGETMPPKSTWVEPKLRSALTIYSLRKH